MTLKLAPNVTVLKVVTRLDVPTERVLNAAIEANLQKCFIVGLNADNELYFASSMADGGDVLWYLEKAKYLLMNVSTDGSDY